MNKRMTDENFEALAFPAPRHPLADVTAYPDLEAVIEEAVRARESEAELLEALRWADHRLDDERHPRTCGVLGEPLCVLHAAVAKATGEKA